MPQEDDQYQLSIKLWVNRHAEQVAVSIRIRDIERLSLRLLERSMVDDNTGGTCYYTPQDEAPGLRCPEIVVLTYCCYSQCGDL
jgi:hypothetical protein